MKIEKIISIGLCILAFSASLVLPASAAKSIEPNNLQIMNKVKMFNNSRLERLDYYIWKININNFITEDLMALYNRLDRLVVPNVYVANSLVAPSNSYNFYSIGSQFDALFECLYTLSIYPLISKNSAKTPIGVYNTKLVAEDGARAAIKVLHSKIDQIEAMTTS